eukprot:TRINITY_DN169_c0_g1_i2.p1 TRINITY_DN169_c0_g1~~TRINITY_DN169_c0_g1_i2.p1  ORF type:complete len:290 (-),score=45.30 TRINITY_DN169_c0_g1_i2:842-1711(-)
MDRYQRVEKPRPETPISENEIRITTQGKMRNYITYATTLLQEKGATEIVLKAMGRAINKTVTIAEIIKRRVAGLHQITTIGSTDITDLWEPLEEGLNRLETTRHVSMTTIILSTKELDKTSTGYQPPLPPEQVKPLAEIDYEGGSPRGRGRGWGRGRGGRGRGGGKFGGEDGAGGNDFGHPDSWGGRGRGRGRSRGRGRGMRGGRGRGIGAGEQGQQQVQQVHVEGHIDGTTYQDHAVGAQNENVGRGRGRGRARGGGRGGRGRGRGRSFAPPRMDGPPQQSAGLVATA